jgi:hypothetical protein
MLSRVLRAVDVSRPGRTPPAMLQCASQFALMPAVLMSCALSSSSFLISASNS